MPEIEERTRGEVLLESIRLCGALEATGTADAGGSATLDDNLLVHPNTDQLKGYNIYIFNGVAQGDDRIISAFTPGSDRVTVVPNFSSSPTTTSEYIILRPPWRVATFIDGMRSAVRYARDNSILVEKVNTELITQDILMGDGNMERWTAGASAAPDNWTLGGNTAIAREATQIAGFLRYSAAMTSDGSNAASMTYTIRNYNAYRGQTVDLRGLIRVDTASRVSMSVDDGVTTNTSTAITNTGTFRDSEADDPAVADLTISDNPTRLRVSLDISAGGAVTAYFDQLRLILTTRSMREYRMPVGDELTLFAYMNAVELGHGEDVFQAQRRYENRHRRPQEFKVIDRENERFLLLTPSSGSGPRPTYSTTGPGYQVGTVPADRPLRIHGQAAPAVLTSDDTQVQMNGTYLSTYAAWYASIQPQHRGIVSQADRDTLQGTWRDLIRRMQHRPAAGSIKVYGH